VLAVYMIQGCGWRSISLVVAIDCVTHLYLSRDGCQDGLGVICCCQCLLCFCRFNGIINSVIDIMGCIRLGCHASGLSKFGGKCIPLLEKSGGDDI